MRPEKTLLDPTGLRRIPSTGFGWIDRGLLRDGWLEQLSQEALLLYLLLVLVSDQRGLSFYGDSTVVRLLKFSHEDLWRARSELLKGGLIAYRHPLYQLLALPKRNWVPPASTPQPKHGGEPTLLAEIFREALKQRERK